MLVHLITLNMIVMNIYSLVDAETHAVLTDTGQWANTGKVENVQKEPNVHFFTANNQMETEATEVRTEVEDTVTTTEATSEDTTVVAVVRTAAARRTAATRRTAAKWRISFLTTTIWLQCNCSAILYLDVVSPFGAK